MEVADIFRDHGPAWRQANAGHVSLGQLKVMSAIERCRTAALGGHVMRCENEKCGHTVIAYNSCRNRHCPKCQGSAAREWLANREAELLPVPYFHVVYTLPGPIADIAYQNKAVIYDLLFKASAETTLKIAADPKHLGASIGILSVLHTWGSALTHHPHVHMIVPGGGLSQDGARWVACRPRYFLPVEVLSALFRRLFLQMLIATHDAGRLQFFGDHARLADKAAFHAYLKPLRNIDWVVYAKEPFAGPQQVLRYLSRYTHRIAISNRRLVSADKNGVTFRYKDYRIEGPARYKTMTLATGEFIRPVPNARPAARLPPHPLLRPARHRRPRRQHRTRARDARSALDRDRRHQGRQRQARRAKITRACLPVLRRSHAHHRDLPAGTTAQAPPDARPAGDRNRHLMTPALLLDIAIPTALMLARPAALALASPRSVIPKSQPQRPPISSRKMLTAPDYHSSPHPVSGTPSATMLRLKAHAPEPAAKSP